MYYVLNKFLSLQHHLSLPGIGNFTVETKPAYIDIANREIEPGISQINFSNEQLPADKLFFHFLTQELNIDEVQAIRRFTDFIAHLQTDIKDGKEIFFKGLGKLKKQSPSTLYFEPEPITKCLPALPAERIIRKNITHTVMVGEAEKTSDEMHAALQEEKAVIVEDRWWIPAIILGLIGIAALIYYYNVLHHHF